MYTPTTITLSRIERTIATTRTMRFAPTPWRLGSKLDIVASSGSGQQICARSVLQAQKKFSVRWLALLVKQQQLPCYPNRLCCSAMFLKVSESGSR